MWQSKIKIFGMPLISVGFFARGFIAIGWSGAGVICIAQFGVGFISITQFGLGIIGLAQFIMGYFTVGQFSLGIIAAIGQKAVGFIALGQSPSGYYEIVITGLKDMPAYIALAADMVKGDPAPFKIWAGIWTAIALYVFMRRGAVTFPMSAADLFRPLVKHSNQLIRLKALGKLDDQRDLAEVVRTDPTLRVRRDALSLITDIALVREFTDRKYNAELRALAVSKIDDREFLARAGAVEAEPKIAEAMIGRVDDDRLLLDIVEGSEFQAARTAAALKLKNPDRARVAKLAAAERDAGIFRILAGFLDDGALENIIIGAGVVATAEAAIGMLKNPDDRFLYGIAVDEKSGPLADDAVYRIADPLLVEKILRSGAPFAARAAALRRVDNRAIVAEISQHDPDEILRKAAVKRLDDIGPLYYSLKMEIRCPQCSQPVFINGPWQKAKCNSCLSAIPLAAGLWKSVAAAELGESVFPRYNGLTLEKSIRHPLCLDCGSELDTDDAAGDDGAVKCTNCGRNHTSISPPKWFELTKYADRIFCTDIDGEEKGENRDDVRMRPVSISCIKCGAPLDVTAETPRNARCSYCKTVQYLPDGLWLSMHPVKVKRPWYLRCTYREKERIGKTF